MTATVTVTLTCVDDLSDAARDRLSSVLWDLTDDPPELLRWLARWAEAEEIKCADWVIEPPAVLIEGGRHYELPTT